MSDLYFHELHTKTVYFCPTRTHFGLTHRKVLLATETQRNMENIEDIYFQTWSSHLPSRITDGFYSKRTVLPVHFTPLIPALALSPVVQQVMVGFNQFQGFINLRL